MATFADLVAAVSSANAAVAADNAAVAADQAKLAADTTQQATDVASVALTQTALGAAIAANGAFFVGPDQATGLVVAYLPDPSATPPYKTITLKPATTATA